MNFCLMSAYLALAAGDADGPPSTRNHRFLPVGPVEMGSSEV